MIGWYVYDMFGELYCGAYDEGEANLIAERINGFARYVSDGGKHDYYY